MSYRILQTPGFGRGSRQLARRYRSWPDDPQGLLERLAATPQQGDASGRGCYKVRLAVAAKGKGKSGGARVIPPVRLVGEVVQSC